MPIRPFATTQILDFLIVAKRLEKTWSTPTLCVRILLRDGSELEVQAIDQASEQWNTLPKQIAFTMTVTRACVKPNKATNVTGIVSTHLLRFEYAITSLKRADDGFDTSVNQIATLCSQTNWSNWNQGKSLTSQVLYIQQVSHQTQTTRISYSAAWCRFSMAIRIFHSHLLVN